MWKITLVAMSSVIESWKPPIWRSALTRSALLVPTSIGVRDPLPGSLEQRVEEELLRLGRADHEALVVAVHLRPHDEPHVRIAEVAEQALREVGQRHVVGSTPSMKS